MKILVDTSVWSLAFRKRIPDRVQIRIIDALSELVRDLRVIMIGPIRQEILSGIAHISFFENLKERISVFIDHPVITEDYEMGALYFNKCRKKGIQGSSIDFLICAIAIRNNFSIFTLDKDFQLYKTMLPLRLFSVKE